jgi:hypothetical protein
MLSNQFDYMAVYPRRLNLRLNINLQRCDKNILLVGDKVNAFKRKRKS